VLEINTYQNLREIHQGKKYIVSKTNHSKAYFPLGVLGADPRINYRHAGLEIGPRICYKTNTKRCEEPEINL